jgi:hypothetical protein
MTREAELLARGRRPKSCRTYEAERDKTEDHRQSNPTRHSHNEPPRVDSRASDEAYYC